MAIFTGQPNTLLLTAALAEKSSVGLRLPGMRGLRLPGIVGLRLPGIVGLRLPGIVGTATAGDAGTATAGTGGVISILYWNGKLYKNRIAEIRDEDGNGELEPNVAYKLDDHGKFVIVEGAK